MIDKSAPRNKLLRATSTPLASIFGSGFLVIVPILAGAVGEMSVAAMAIVCAFAYAVGAVIRYNIQHAEPVLAAHPAKSTELLERASDISLIFAYIISVCLYLHILSAFVLGGLNLDTPVNEDTLTTAVILAITIIGVVRGLGMLESLESIALMVTLGIIVLLFGGFGIYDWQAWHSSTGIVLPSALNHSAWQVATIVAGTLIVVQGFETPRYLGDEFDAPTRVLASRWSQIISTVVYIIFVTLTLPVVHTLKGHYDDNSLIQLVAVAAGALATPLIIAAALSQFSAAVADTLAATGNMEESTQGKIKVKAAYIIVGAGATVLAWAADTLEIVAIASRAFALYYLLQCLVAISISKSLPERIGMGLVALVLAFIAVFAVPAS